jgi:hypothetical protein
MHATTTMDGRPDRVRAHTDTKINRRLDEAMERILELYALADRETLTQRIEELDEEWDMERLLETNAAAVSLAGLALGTCSDRKWFILPAIVSGFLLQHAIQGWCPPVPVLRRLGMRTRKEIERERFALKAIRGDFEAPKSGERFTAKQALAAVDR